MIGFANTTAIAGWGATEFSKNSGRTEMQLAAEAIVAALDDAGLAVSSVDGLVTLGADNNSEIEVLRVIGGKELTFFSTLDGGGGSGAAAIMNAAMAVATGVANTIVVYRAMNERSEYRFGQPMTMQVPTAMNALFAYQGSHGMQTGAAMMALCMRRYMHETGARAEDFGRLVVTQRTYAATNPNAFFYGRPLSLEHYLQSRMIADPLRLPDCCQESDGAVAFVITSLERARSLRNKPAVIRAAAQALPNGTSYLSNYYRTDIVPFEESQLVARQLYRMAGLTPEDMNAAIIYDHYAPSVLPTLEAYGFCARGEAKDFIKNGTIELDGRLPVNMNGGQIGEAYIHGYNGIAEAVRQVRGTGSNQVADLENILVAAASGTPTSGLILGRDR